MGHIRGLTKLGLEINPPYLGDWPKAIGVYMLNFTAIELFSYQYLNALEATRADFEKNLNKLLRHRVDRILDLIATSAVIPVQDKAALSALWDEVKTLSVWRNWIAHNPVVPAWKPGSDPTRDPPDTFGVTNMRQLKGKDVTDSISLQGLKKLSKASADVGKRLHAAVLRIQGSVQQP